MKKVKFLGLAMVTSILILIACNNESKEKSEEKNESATKEMKKDTASLPVSTTSPLTTTYTTGNLPVGVKEFVSKNYAGYTIVNAIPDPLCQGGAAIDVAVTKTGATNLSLIFKPDGSFVQQEEDVPLSAVSNKIRDVIKTKFAGYSTGNQIEKLTLVDKTIQYMVDLNKGKVTKEVIFSVDGNVVCEN